MDRRLHSRAGSIQLRKGSKDGTWYLSSLKTKEHSAQPQPTKA